MRRLRSGRESDRAQPYPICRKHRPGVHVGTGAVVVEYPEVSRVVHDHPRAALCTARPGRCPKTRNRFCGPKLPKRLPHEPASFVSIDLCQPPFQQPFDICRLDPHWCERSPKDPGEDSLRIVRTDLKSIRETHEDSPAVIRNLRGAAEGQPLAAKAPVHVCVLPDRSGKRPQGTDATTPGPGKRHLVQPPPIQDLGAQRGCENR